MTPAKTHREVKDPKVSARYLAEYMAASETSKRTVIRKCKYQPIAGVVQHDEAKLVISTFIHKGLSDASYLLDKVEYIRGKIADTDFERDVLDHNADYVDRFAKVFPELEMPKGERLPAGPKTPMIINGVKINPDIQFRLQRTTRTNKLRVGAGVLRYAKGKSLNPNVAAWQSAFLFGYLSILTSAEASEPECGLCLTIDAHAGEAYAAPTDSLSRFHHMEAACLSIAERWPNIMPPPNAVL